MSNWEDKPCQRCGGGKGAKYRTLKYCGNCQYKVKKEKSANAHARALESRYGITRTDYWDLYAFQGGVCYICQRATGKTRRLTVDHDHATGLVRGLLCRPCNTLLGHIRDSLESAARIHEYLINPPFAVMLEGKRTNTLGAQDGGSRGGRAAGIGGDISA